MESQPPAGERGEPPVSPRRSSRRRRSLSRRLQRRYPSLRTRNVVYFIFVLFVSLAVSRMVGQCDHSPPPAAE
jgi:hypothetical protein